jgi:hypothetical protein
VVAFESPVTAVGGFPAWGFKFVLYGAKFCFQRGAVFPINNGF